MRTLQEIDDEILGCHRALSELRYRDDTGQDLVPVTINQDWEIQLHTNTDTKDGIGNRVTLSLSDLIIDRLEELRQERYKSLNQENA